MNIKLTHVAECLEIEASTLRWKAKKGYLPYVQAIKGKKGINTYIIIPTKFKEFYGDEMYDRLCDIVRNHKK